MAANAFSLGLIPRYTITFTEKHIVNQLEMRIDLLDRLLQERNFDGAASVYTTMIGEYKESDGVVFAIGLLLIQVLERLNNENATKNFFRTILSHLAPAKTTSSRYHYIILESLMYKIRGGDLVGAEFMLQDQMRMDRVSSDPVFQAMRAMVTFRRFLYGRGHSYSSWMQWKQANIDDPSDLDAEPVETSIRHMEEALRLDSSNASYLYFLCLFLLQNREEMRAADTCRIFCTKNPDCALGWLIQAKLLRMLDSRDFLDREIESWRKYATLDPTSDEAFIALLMHYRGSKKVGTAVMLRVLMGRMDTVIDASDSMANWKLFAALLVAREKALSTQEYSTIGTPEDDREFMTALYTWKQRYWSAEAWKVQNEEMNTVTKIAVVLSCMLVFGKTAYTICAIRELAKNSEADLRFHMNFFQATNLLEQHLAVIARLKAADVIKNEVQSRHGRVVAFKNELRATNISENALRLLSEKETEAVSSVLKPAAAISADLNASIHTPNNLHPEEAAEMRASATMDIPIEEQILARTAVPMGREEFVVTAPVPVIRAPIARAPGDPLSPAALLRKRRRVVPPDVQEGSEPKQPKLSE